MHILNFTLIVFIAFVFSAAGTGLVRAALTGRVMDVPNQRSAHTVPTPRGGGIAVMVAVLGFMMVAQARADILIAALLLAVVSFVDDMKGLSARFRFGVQLLAVMMALDAVVGNVFQGLLPPILDKLAAGILWIWFINLFNFMDGIDGLAATETISLGVGIFVIALVVPGVKVGLDIDGAIIAAAGLGFMLWNYPPAKIFLGDVGSIPLGYLLGYMLLDLAGSGYWAAAIILPLYYLADATLTLFNRWRKGQVLWQAHNEHFYQQAARSGIPVETINRYVMGLNLVLITLALVSTQGYLVSLIALGIALFLVFIVLSYFRLPVRTQKHAPQA